MSDIKKLLEDFSRIESSTTRNSENLNEFGFLSKLQKSLEKRSPYQPTQQQDTTSWQPNQQQLAWLNKGGATNVDRFDPAIIARMPASLGDKPPLQYYKPEDQKYAQQTAFIPQAIKDLTTPVDLKTPLKPEERADADKALQRVLKSQQQQQLPSGMEPSLEENGLQAHLGNKKYGKEGMDALRKAGRDGASKEKMAKIRAKYDKLDEQGVAEGLSLNSITAIGSFIPNFVQRAFAAGKIEAQDSAKFAQILGKWLGTGQISPQESDFAKEQFIDILKAIAGGALAYAAVAPMASAHAASGVASIINHAVEHTAADMTFEALAAVLAKKLGFNLPQKILHGLTTSGGRAAEKEHEHSPTNPQLDRYVDKKFQQAKTGFGGMTENRAVNRLTRKFENYLSNRFEMLESGYGSEKKKFKVEAAPAAPIYPNAQDPNAQTTSPQPSTAQATKDEQDKKREQQVDIATAKGTMSGLKNVLGSNLDINQAASAVTKINDGKPLTGPEQQAMSAITPLLAKAAEMPQTASNLKTSLTNAAYLAKLGK